MSPAQCRQVRGFMGGGRAEGLPAISLRMRRSGCVRCNCIGDALLEKHPLGKSVFLLPGFRASLVFRDPSRTLLRTLAYSDLKGCVTETSLLTWSPPVVRMRASLPLSPL